MSDEQAPPVPGAAVGDPGRRNFLRTAAAFGGMALLARHGLAAAGDTVQLPFANGTRRLVAYPQKRPLMVLTERPVQLETPMAAFDSGVFTPNDAFFVRWHLADMPTRVSPGDFRLQVRGRVKAPLSLSLDDLRKRFETVEVAAVCQCAGNGRGFSQPPVGGSQWGNGAMGNALWQGVRLGDLLECAGLESGAVQVRFDGLDRGLLAATPDFRKSLPMEAARRDDVLIAYAMNGEPLPLLNGFPLRLVVPGWYATYWVKMLHDIEVLDREDEGFWMQTAYRIPDNPCACVPPGGKPARTVPIARMNVRSFITSVADGALVTAGETVAVRGVAFDGGAGIRGVMFSQDGGRRWTAARLGSDRGKYSFRQWDALFKPRVRGSYELLCRAVSAQGETQPTTPAWNPSGYLRNVIETVRVRAV